MPPVMPFAHLLAPSSAPAALGWTASLGLATGLCLLFLARAGWRWAGAALCLLAGAAGLSMVVVASGSARPDQRLLLMAPDSSVELTNPVEIHVCALTAGGSPAPLPGAGRMLAVLVDDIPVGTRTSPVLALELPPGRHRLGVELVTAEHRAFSPPLAADVTVRVGPGRGPLAAAGACPR
jgi:hypothetical protein